MINILIDQTLKYVKWIQIVIILHFSEDCIKKLVKPELKDEYEKDKYNFLPSESEELHSTFQVDGVRFTCSLQFPLDILDQNGINGVV